MSVIATPFGILLMFLYDLVKNYGVAIILFAVIIKIVLLPFQMKSKRGMMRQTRLQPKMKELEKRHSANKAKYNEEVMKLYKEEGVSPASGCLWSFITLPIMLALFYAIKAPLTIMMGVPAELLREGGAILAKLNEMNFSTTVGSYYLEIAQSQFISAHFAEFQALSDKLRLIDFNFLGIDLGSQPQWNYLWTTTWSDVKIWLPGLVLFIIPLLSGGAQFLNTWAAQKTTPAAATPENQAGTMKMMTYMMPLFSVYIAFITPGALGFYWTLSALLQLVQDVILTKHYTRILDAEDAERNEERRKKEAELEAKRIESERKKAEGIVEKNPNVSKRKKQISEKQEQLEKAAEWQKRNEPPPAEEPSREGNRRYARGRAYDPDRYTRESGAEESDGNENREESAGENEELREAAEQGEGTEAAEESVETEESENGEAADADDGGEEEREE